MLCTHGAVYLADLAPVLLLQPPLRSFFAADVGFASAHSEIARMAKMEWFDVHKCTDLDAGNFDLPCLPFRTNPSGAVARKLEQTRWRDIQDFGGPRRALFELINLLGLGTWAAHVLAFGRGTTRRVLGYEGMRGKLGAQRSGVLVSMADGQATLHALGALEQRGTLFIAPGDQIYAGMIVGENARDGDMDVNPVRAKKLDNMRTQSKDEKVRLQPPRRMTLEDAMGYCMADELIECATGGTVRLRKRILDPSKRKATTRGGGK